MKIGYYTLECSDLPMVGELAGVNIFDHIQEFVS